MRLEKSKNNKQTTVMILITLAQEDVDDEIKKEKFLSVQECNTH